MDLNTASLMELKAFAYDTLSQIEFSQNQLKMINQKIMEKINEQNAPKGNPVAKPLTEEIQEAEVIN